MERLIPLIRFNLIILAGILVCCALYYGQQILILLSFAILFSMLMTPVAEKMERRGIGRIWSTIFCILILLLAFSLIFILVGKQINNIIDEMPQIQKKVDHYLADLQNYIQEAFGISPQKQIQMVKEQISNLSQYAGKYVQITISKIIEISFYFIMIMVFMFLFLLQREKYKKFFIEVYKGHSIHEAEEVVENIVKVSHSYLTGMFLSMILQTILYSIGFLIIGIENAVLLAAIAASLIIIPYIGAWIGGLFPFMMAILTEDSFAPALGVVGVMVFIQTIDNNFIEPYIVGGEVKLSAATSIISLFIGGALWGIPGVILFLPLAGIVKILFDHTPSLKPYAYLIGDQEDRPPSQALANWFKKIFKKKS